MNYLIVDDDSIFADTLCRRLIRRGAQASTAYSANQAIQELEKSSYHRIVLDLKIGEDSGLRLLPKLKSLAPETDIVLLTGYSSIPTAVEAIKQGAMQYLCKPASLDEILAAFEKTSPQAISEVDIRSEPHSVERLEWEHIQKVLHKNKGNVSATARALGMHRRTLQRKLQKRPVSE